MGVNWKSPKSIMKAVSVFIALNAIAAVVVMAGAVGFETVAPEGLKGYGLKLKAWLGF